MTNNLGWPSMAPNQTQKEQTHNDGMGRLDAAMTAVFTQEVDASFSIASSDYLRHHTFTLTAGDVADAFTMTVPADVRGLFTVINNSGQTATVGIASQSVTAPTLATGAAGLFHSDGVNVRALLGSSDGGGDDGGGDGGDNNGITFAQTSSSNFLTVPEGIAADDYILIFVSAPASNLIGFPSWMDSIIPGVDFTPTEDESIFIYCRGFIAVEDDVGLDEFEITASSTDMHAYVVRIPSAIYNPNDELAEVGALAGSIEATNHSVPSMDSVVAGGVFLMYVGSETTTLIVPEGLTELGDTSLNVGTAAGCLAYGILAGSGDIPQYEAASSTGVYSVSVGVALNPAA